MYGGLTQDQSFEVLDVELKESQERKSLLELNSATKIVTICQNYNLVVMLDQSSSMRTVENKVLSSIAFETYVKLMLVSASV
jgi:hypothetical protein